jgi:glycosyltransferase involved in cell wall biosynthesis
MQNERAGGPARKIMIVSTSLGFGGADTQIVNIARVLRSCGREVSIVSLIRPDAHLAVLAGAGVAVHSLGMKPGVADPRAIVRLARLIHREKPDVVHSHMVHANLLARVTRCVARMPALVCTAHNTRESSQKGGPTWHKEFLYRLTDRLADQTTIICKAGYRHYVESKAVPASRLKVMPLGIDCADFAPDAKKRLQARLDLGLPAEHFTFLTVGRMVVQKDYPNLLRAFSLLKHKSWTLLVGGSGPLQPELEQLCEELSLKDRVQFLGVRQDVRAWYHAADAFVMGSEVEGMPVVLLEAAASGLPAVVTDAGGNGEAVVSGKTGFVVPKQNHLALSAAIERILDMPRECRERFSAEARAWALQEFEIGAVVSRWESLYEDCLFRGAPAYGQRFAPMPSSPGVN